MQSRFPGIETCDLIDGVFSYEGIVIRSEQPADLNTFDSIRNKNFPPSSTLRGHGEHTTLT
jgi:hypothetical protein